MITVVLWFRQERGSRLQVNGERALSGRTLAGYRQAFGMGSELFAKEGSTRGLAAKLQSHTPCSTGSALYVEDARTAVRKQPVLP